MDMSSINTSSSVNPTHQHAQKALQGNEFDHLLKTHYHLSTKMPKELQKQPVKQLLFHLLYQLQLASSQHIAAKLSEKIKKLLQPLESLIFDLFEHAQIALIHPKKRHALPTEQRLSWLYEETHLFYENYAHNITRNPDLDRILKGIHQSIQSFKHLLSSET